MIGFWWLLAKKAAAMLVKKKMGEKMGGKMGGGGGRKGTGPPIVDSGFKMPDPQSAQKPSSLVQNAPNFGSVTKSQDTMAGLAGHAGSFVKNRLGQKYGPETVDAAHQALKRFGGLFGR